MQLYAPQYVISAPFTYGKFDGQLIKWILAQVRESPYVFVASGFTCPFFGSSCSLLAMYYARIMRTFYGPLNKRDSCAAHARQGGHLRRRAAVSEHHG